MNKKQIKNISNIHTLVRFDKGKLAKTQKEYFYY
jgi:hypothetical protein